MISLFQRNKPVSALLDGYVENHCHILPGVDDGSRDMEDSLEMLDAYGRAGVREIWITPHVMEDIPNTPDHLRDVFNELKSAYSGNIKLHLASENMLDSLFLERLESGELLPHDSNTLLVETSFYNPPMDLYGILGKIKAGGFFPLLAHPERYMYMDKSEYMRLHDDGILFQLNLPSLTGLYGPEARAKAEWLLDRGMYACSGLDLHRASVISRISSETIKSSRFDSLQKLEKH